MKVVIYKLRSAILYGFTKHCVLSVSQLYNVWTISSTINQVPATQSISYQHYGTGTPNYQISSQPITAVKAISYQPETIKFVIYEIK